MASGFGGGHGNHDSGINATSFVHKQTQLSRAYVDLLEDLLGQIVLLPRMTKA